MDLAGPGRAYPTTAGPWSDRGSTPPVGTPPSPAPTVEPGQGPTRVSEPPLQDHPPGRRTETLPTRPRTPTRFPEQAHRSTSTSRKNPTPKHDTHHTSKKGLNDKLRAELVVGAAG